MNSRFIHTCNCCPQPNCSRDVTRRRTSARDILIGQPDDRQMIRRCLIRSHAGLTNTHTHTHTLTKHCHSQRGWGVQGGGGVHQAAPPTFDEILSTWCNVIWACTWVCTRVCCTCQYVYWFVSNWLQGSTSLINNNTVRVAPSSCKCWLLWIANNVLHVKTVHICTLHCHQIYCLSIKLSQRNRTSLNNGFASKTG